MIANARLYRLWARLASDSFFLADAWSRPGKTLAERTRSVVEALDVAAPQR